MDDVNAFLGQYRQSLLHSATEFWPNEVADLYRPDSCLKDSPDRRVYLVTDRRTGGKAILRVLRLSKDMTADPEYGILLRLNHPGIPKTYGHYVHAGWSYLARQYFEGDPLDRAVAGIAMSTPQIYDLCRQLCGLLGYLHSQNPPVIHRDVKPENIIVRPDGTLGLTDFGIARVYKKGSDSDTHYAGTFPYAPPEQWGYAQSSPQTDIHALGMVLIYLVTGEPDRRDLDRRIKDPQLRGLIERCIDMDPKRRFQNVQEVVKRIDSVKTRRLRRVGVIAGAVVVVMLAAIGLWRFNWADGAAGGPKSGAAPQIERTSAGSPDPTDEASQGVASGPALFDSELVGNLSGNISNGGIAVEGDGVIYLATSDAIYELNPDGTERGLLITAKDPRALNFWRGKLYYSSPDSGYTRYDPVTDEYSPLIEDDPWWVYIEDEQLYMANIWDGPRTELFVSNAEGSNERQITSETASIFLVYQGYFYFANENDGGRLYRMNLETGAAKMIYDTNVFWLSAYDTHLYFTEGSTEVGSLWMANLDGSEARRVTTPLAYTPLRTAEHLFYRNFLDELVRVPPEGGQETVLTQNKAGKFCVAGDWVFYRNEDDDSATWMVRTDGTDDHRFEPKATPVAD
ncbi:MAG: DUF5050 domain-containing protein [Bifidobacteriaceae bacterium]|nr:DUF5050 domain-containing protein [Bifidobacteriaceae bacterium]